MMINHNLPLRPLFVFHCFYMFLFFGLFAVTLLTGPALSGDMWPTVCLVINQMCQSMRAKKRRLHWFLRKLLWWCVWLHAGPLQAKMHQWLGQSLKMFDSVWPVLFCCLLAYLACWSKVRYIIWHSYYLYTLLLSITAFVSAAFMHEIRYHAWTYNDIYIIF